MLLELIIYFKTEFMWKCYVNTDLPVLSNFVVLELVSLLKRIFKLKELKSSLAASYSCLPKRYLTPHDSVFRVSYVLLKVLAV